MNNIDRRLVFEFAKGQMTFRHLAPNAGYQQLLDLAFAINEFQTDDVERFLLVTTQQFAHA